MALEAGLRVEFERLAQAPAPRDVLGIATFGLHPQVLPRASDIPVARIPTPVLDNAEPLQEIWRTSRPATSGRQGSVHYRHDGQLLFGSLAVTETVPLRELTVRAYAAILEALEALDYPHLVRVWNYLPRINEETEGTERYWQFNSGRRAALLNGGREVTGNVPAACALGSFGDAPLSIYFLASREPAALLENPRQVSAYEYPDQYGPRPAFSRASLLHPQAAPVLFISGTASIVGHETVHANDAAAQARETVRNVQTLLAQAQEQTGAAAFDLLYKVYVRHREDLPVIREQLQDALDGRVIYLQADICRTELLVEIEAVGLGVRERLAGRA